MMKHILSLVICIMFFLTACDPEPVPAPITANPTANLTPTPTQTPSPTPTRIPEPDYLVLQQGNNFPKSPIQTKVSSELIDNRIGLYIHNLPTIHYWDSSDWLNLEVYDLGGKRMKFAINELDVGMVDWSEDEFLVTSPQDDFITSLADNGIISSYILSFWDKANHSENWAPTVSRFKTEDEVLKYLDFVRFIVPKVMGRVQYFEIWNEPDVGDLRQRIEIPEYINLVKRVVPLIRSIYPEARIVVSVAGTGDWASRDYLYQLVQSDEIMPLVDVISWHPFYDSSPEFEMEYYYGYQVFVQYIKNTAYAHGFRGEYWATEITWRSPECAWCSVDLPSNSNIAAAKYYARGILMNLGMGVTVGVGGMSSILSSVFPTVRNINTIMDTAEPVNIPFTVDSGGGDIKSYAFTLSNGDGLIALWTDGAAVDIDPGVSVSVTLPGSSVEGVTGFDVLNGFEQELIYETVNGNLVIPNLLVKDYPIILRLTEPNFAEITPLEAPTEELLQEPVFPIKISLRPNRVEQIPTGTPIQLTLRIATDTEEQNLDFLAALNLTGTLDGQPLPDLDNYWGRIWSDNGGDPEQDMDYISYWLYPLGILSPGIHALEIVGTLNVPVTDGFDQNKDGQLNEYTGDLFDISMQIEVN